MDVIIRINDSLYIVKRITSIMYEPAGAEWNKISDKHKTFKKDEKIYFCIEIEEAEIVE